MNELTRFLGYAYLYQDNGEIFILRFGYPRYGTRYQEYAWHFKFPDSISLNLRRLRAVTELIKAGVCTPEQARNLVGIRE